MVIFLFSYLFYGIFFAILGAILADNKNRNAYIWVLLSFFFGLFAVLILLALKELPKQPASGGQQYALSVPKRNPLEGQYNRVDLLVRSLQDNAPLESIKLLVDALVADGIDTDKLMWIALERAGTEAASRLKDAIKPIKSVT